MGGILRFGLFLVILIVVVAIVLSVILMVSWSRGPLPEFGGEVSVDGLNDTVEILRDSWGVPHIYATNPEDLFFAQGYTQAQDRWWQMEWARHIGQGRLSELAGESTFGYDIMIRSMGWERAAEEDWRNLPPEMQTYLEAFAAGVNAYIMDRPPSKLAFEYNVLGLTGVDTEIEEWTPIDSLVWSKVMAWSLSGSQQSREKLLDELLEELPEQMVVEYAPLEPFGAQGTIVQVEDLPLSQRSLDLPDDPLEGVASSDGASWDYAGSVSADDEFMFPQDFSIGSNNWVVHGDKTETGMPLLANDPHLGIQMPSIWYEIGLHCENVSRTCPFNVVGFAFAPSPGVVVGHNDHIAWGVTNAGPDTQDLYKIEVNPRNDLQYNWDGQWLDMEEYEEEIIVNGREDPVEINVRVTHLGPIINDNQLDEDGEVEGYNNDDPIALRWTALDEGGSKISNAVINLNTATNWQEFRDALRDWDTPSQNFIYADIDGNIGYQLPGKIPIRTRNHRGLLPVEGNTDKFEWLGYVPFDELPRVLNPDRGYVSSANQAIAPQEYYEQLVQRLGSRYGSTSEYIFSYFWAYGYRGQRINELLDETNSHSFETFQEMHGDNLLISARDIMPFLQDLEFDDTQLDETLAWLGNWNYRMDPDSAQAALYANFWNHLVRNTFNDQLDGITEPDGGTQNMWALAQLVEDPSNVWWDDIDTPPIERRDDILEQSFVQALDDTIAQLGEDRSHWRWGDLHVSNFVSDPLGQSGIGVIENMVNRGGYPTGGGPAVLNATRWDASSDSFELTSLPSLRMIVDMEDFTQSKSIHTTGQSGHPFSNHYDDMIQPWLNIEYHDMLWTRDQVEAAAVETLILQPEDD